MRCQTKVDLEGQLSDEHNCDCGICHEKYVYYDSSKVPGRCMEQPTALPCGDILAITYIKAGTGDWRVQTKPTCMKPCDTMAESWANELTVSRCQTQHLYWKAWCKLISAVRDPTKLNFGAEWEPISINISRKSTARGFLWSCHLNTCFEAPAASLSQLLFKLTLSEHQSSSLLWRNQWLKVLWPDRLNTEMLFITISVVAIFSRIRSLFVMVIMMHSTHQQYPM